MRPTLVLTALALALAGVSLLMLKSYTTAQPAPPLDVVGVGQPPAQLPISQAVLFSSGVGFFQRDGQIDGNARIDLSFPVQDINDLLKSMIVQDLGNGQVSAVSYDSQAPVEKTLRSFAVNLTGNPTFGQILNQTRGEKVEVVLQATTAQAATITGVIMGVEKKAEAVGKEAVANDYLTLWCAEGMRSLKLADVQRVRFLNPAVQTEVKKALETLALAHDTQKKTVSLSFTGQGKRSVKVGYVIENPIWKTSYRLVLKGKGKAYLQGWAIVENTQDEDWNNVRLALVAGRPISFQMDLYQSLYMTRPIVEPELFASLRPPTYQGAMGGERDAWGRLTERQRASKESLKQSREEEEEEEAPAKKGENQKMFRGLLAAGKVTVMGKNIEFASAAVATNLGDFFQYAIEQPVNLARQKSAMLPIVTQEIDGSRVSIYNASTHPKFPLLGLKFKNSTNLHLMQGPITVFDGNTYAGDARILDLQPKEERLISYAIDLGTEVEPIASEPADRITVIKINKGIIEATHRVRQAKMYNVKNRSEQDRTLIIEHPYRAEAKLVRPEKFSERARDVYRFEMPVKAGGSAKLDVVEESDVVQTVTIGNTEEQTILLFLNHQATSPKVKTALQQATALKTKLADIQRELAHHNEQLKDIAEDQARLRANLKEMPPTAVAYKRYLEKFDKQETETEQLQARIKQLQTAELQQRQELDTYLGNLIIE